MIKTVTAAGTADLVTGTAGKRGFAFQSLATEVQWKQECVRFTLNIKALCVIHCRVLNCVSERQGQL